MTIGAVTLPLEYSGNGVADTFAYTWKVASKTHLSVVVVTDADGTRTSQTEGVDYTVTGVGASTGGNIVFGTAPASGTTVVIDSVVPYTQPTDLKNQGDFYPETHEDAFDRTVRQIQQVHRDQQRSLQIPTGQDDYDAGGVKITDLADGVDATDAATVGQLDDFAAAILAGFAGSSVAVASGTGDGANVNLSFPGITVTVDAAYLLVVGGVLQKPTTDFTADPANDRLIATTAPGLGVDWFAVCIGYERAINVLASGSVGTAQLDDDAVTFAKMQNISTDTLLGRSTAGTGNVEQITCTSAGRALLDDATAGDQRTTLGINAALILSLMPTGSVIARAYSSSTTQADYATNIPRDNTVPQNTEGTEIFTVSVTPTANADRVRIRAVINGSSSGASDRITVALFKDSDASAIQVASTCVTSSNDIMQVVLEFEHSPATTSAVTYKIRAGSDAGTFKLNKDNSAAVYGGSMASTLVAEVIKG